MSTCMYFLIILCFPLSSYIPIPISAGFLFCFGVGRGGRIDFICKVEGRELENSGVFFLLFVLEAVEGEKITGWCAA